MRQSLSCLGLTLCAVLHAGCTLTSNLDRFHEAKAGGDAATPTGDAATADGGDAAAGASIGCGNPATLCLQLSGFEEYKGELVVIDLVSEDGKLRARAMLDPASDEAKQSVVMPLAIPKADIPGPLEEPPLHLEVWADKDDDREYSAEKDEGYRFGLTAGGVVQYTRDDDDIVDLTPQPVGKAGDFRMNLSGFKIHPKRMFEAVVIETQSGRTLGLSRFGAIPSDGIFTVEIPSIVDTAGTDYTIEFYADRDNDRVYGGVGPDHSWVVERKSDGDGLQFDRTHSAPSSGPDKDDPSFKFAPLKYQFAFQP